MFEKSALLNDAPHLYAVVLAPWSRTLANSPNIGKLDPVGRRLWNNNRRGNVSIMLPISIDSSVLETPLKTCCIISILNS